LCTIETAGAAVLCHGRGAIFQQCSCVLGPLALVTGSGVTDADVDTFLVALGEHRSLAITIQEAFILALQAKGVLLHESPVPSVPSVGESV
jgi:hypothetical protein